MSAELGPDRGPDGIASVDHVAITVRDMERAIRFYRDLLGCSVLGQLVLDEGTFKLVYLRKGRAYIELFAHRSSPPAGEGTGEPQQEGRPGFQHLAFQVDDVDAVAARLAAAGVSFTTHPTDATGNVRLAFFRDPDGNTLELVSRLPDMEPYRPGWD